MSIWDIGICVFLQELLQTNLQQILILLVNKKEYY